LVITSRADTHPESASRLYTINTQHEKILNLNMLKEKPLGNDLLSQEVALQVPSALMCLTTGFGMGPGVPTSLKSPRDNFTKDCPEQQIDVIII
jgi:hypothetical protein